HRGVPVVLTFWTHDDGEHVRGVSLCQAEEGTISGMKTYMHSPELIAEVCKDLGVTFPTPGYRNWEAQPPRGATHHAHAPRAAALSQLAEHWSLSHVHFPQTAPYSPSRALNLR